MKATEFITDGDDKNPGDVKANHPEIYNFMKKLMGSMALDRGKVETYNTAGSHYVIVTVQPTAGFQNTLSAFRSIRDVDYEVRDGAGASSMIVGTFDDIKFAISQQGQPGNLKELWRFALPHKGELTEQERGAKPNWFNDDDDDRWGDDDEEVAAVITGELPAKSYWAHTGKYQKYSEKLEELIPAQGEVSDPALEKFRVLANVYYDQYNNGNLFNTGEMFVDLFNRNRLTTDELEALVDQTIMLAWKEQKAKGELTEQERGVKQNWFNTLAQALEAEDITHMWDSITMGGIGYGETKRWTFDDGTRNGHFITIFRDDRGMYERPIHYKR